MRKLLFAAALSLLALTGAVSAQAQDEGGSESAGDPDGRQTVAELFEDASLWRVGENKEKVESAREQLAERGREAVSYILDNELGTTETLRIRAIDAVLNKLRDAEWLAGTLLEHWEQASDATSRWHLLRQFGRLEIEGGLPLAWEVIENAGPEVTARPAVREISAAMSAVRKLEQPGAEGLDRLDPFLTGNSDALAIAAARSFGELGTEREIDVLLDLHGGLLMPRRDTFEAALSELFEERGALLREKLNNWDQPTRLGAQRSRSLTLSALVEIAARQGVLETAELVEYLGGDYPERVAFAAVRGGVEGGALAPSDLPSGTSEQLRSYCRSLYEAKQAAAESGSGESE